jgi:LPS O-antigen subunit length determinant protein (WzzB/FepE family)
MNPYEVGDLEPQEPQRQLTVGPRRLFWMLMVIIGGFVLGLIVLFVLGALVAGFLLSA